MNEGRKAAGVMIGDPIQIQGVNTVEELALLERAVRWWVATLMLRGWP